MPCFNCIILYIQRATCSHGKVTVILTYLGFIKMQFSPNYPAEIHNVNYDVGCKFLIYPINLKTGAIDFNELQSAIILQMSGNIEKAVNDYAGGMGFDWTNTSKHPEEVVRRALEKKYDSILSLLVYNCRLDLDLDVSDHYLLMVKHDRIVMTTESLMRSNLGFITHPVDNLHPFPVNQPNQIRSTDLYADHAEFNILVHHLIEVDTHEIEVQNHCFVTFEPLEFNKPCTTQSFNFFKAHQKRDYCKSEFDWQLHYDFFHQNWHSVKGISTQGLLPNGNTLVFKQTNIY